MPILLSDDFEEEARAGRRRRIEGDPGWHSRASGPASAVRRGLVALGGASVSKAAHERADNPSSIPSYPSALAVSARRRPHRVRAM
jgi:hypothetical protein